MLGCITCCLRFSKLSKFYRIRIIFKRKKLDWKLLIIPRTKRILGLATRVATYRPVEIEERSEQVSVSVAI